MASAGSYRGVPAAFPVMKKRLYTAMSSNGINYRALNRLVATQIQESS